LEANEHVGAERFYNREQNGLSIEWRARSLYLNPPGTCSEKIDELYECGGKRCSCELPKKFFSKLVDSWSTGAVDSAIYLAYSQEQLRWARVPSGCLIAIPHKRIPFVGAGSSPTHANAFVFFHSRADQAATLERFWSQFDPVSEIFIKS